MNKVKIGRYISKIMVGIFLIGGGYMSYIIGVYKNRIFWYVEKVEKGVVTLTTKMCNALAMGSEDEILSYWKDKTKFASIVLSHDSEPVLCERLKSKSSLDEFGEWQIYSLRLMVERSIYG